MHIQEGSITTLTTCTKMTEELDRRHGVNGHSSRVNGVNEDVPAHNSSPSSTGGRLKFFKDGKFILELVRESERPGWVSVPRKTYWPPTGAPPTPRPLSLSDDNSSVQSSPWQRDHCWKQPAPRRDRARALAFYYCRPAALPADAVANGARARRRRPHAPMPAQALSDLLQHLRQRKPHHRKLRVHRKSQAPRRRRDLTRALAKLSRAPPAPAPAPAPAPSAAPAKAPTPPVHAKLAGCRAEHALVSPRKRILREMERVSLEEAGGKRRAGAAPAPAAAPGPSAAPHVSPYSITSLLSRSERPPPPPHYYWPPPQYRAPPPLWMHYAVAAPPPWPPMAHPLIHHHMPREEPASDLPLNLSKH